MGYALVELIAGLYSNQKAAVRWNGQLTEWFSIGRGTRQGCNISPTEFNLYAERIMRKLDEKNIEEDSEGELVIGGRRLTNLRYADDTTLLASTQEKAQKIFKDLILESAQYNMQINVKKTKTMVVTRNEGIQAKLEHEGEHLDQVKDFTF